MYKCMDPPLHTLPIFEVLLNCSSQDLIKPFRELLFSCAVLLGSENYAEYRLYVWFFLPSFPC